MTFEFDYMVLLTGLAIFLARIVDVSLGTLRVINIVHGRSWMAFWLGFWEVVIWINVISAVIRKIEAVPILTVFYALGFAAGNAAGIRLEKWLAFGHIILRVISLQYYREMARAVRAAGFGVTIFQGEGQSGPVQELYIVCRRRDLKRILALVNSIEPDVFYITEQVGSVSKLYRPLFQQTTGWRNILKKK